MPRIPRVLIANACYHVTSRGNQKQQIFFNEEDRRCYLGILKKAKQRYGIQLYAYCLMPNHIHLLADPDVQEDLSRFMHWMNRGYTAYFNKEYAKVGHLWQGRFGSKPIVKNEYLLACAEYIEANPVRAGLVKSIAHYKWSSFRERNLLTAPTGLLDEFIPDRPVAVERAVLL